jgi:hypothetical protein
LSTLSSVIIRGTLAAMPAAGIPGRTYYTSDTLQVFYDDGVTWKTRSLRPAGTKTPRAHARAGAEHAACRSDTGPRCSSCSYALGSALKRCFRLMQPLPFSTIVTASLHLFAAWLRHFGRC